jgi:hypothetical protein
MRVGCAGFSNETSGMKPVVKARAGLAGAEALLAAEIEGQPRLQLALVRGEVPHHAAEVIVVAVREDERIDLGGIHAHQFDVVVERVRGETEIDLDVPRLAAARGLDQQRQPPFVQQVPRRGIRRRPGVALHLHVGELAGRLEEMQVGVGQHPHRQAVHLRRCAGERLRARDLDAGEEAAGEAEAAGAQGGEETAAGEVAQILAHANLLPWRTGNEYRTIVPGFQRWG